VNSKKEKKLFQNKKFKKIVFHKISREMTRHSLLQSSFAFTKKEMFYFTFLQKETF